MEHNEDIEESQEREEGLPEDARRRIWDSSKYLSSNPKSFSLDTNASTSFCSRDWLKSWRRVLVKSELDTLPMTQGQHANLIETLFPAKIQSLHGFAQGYLTSTCQLLKALKKSGKHTSFIVKYPTKQPFIQEAPLFTI